MKVLNFATYIFYRYYDKGSTKIIAYESALIAISALIFMNIFALLIFVGVDINKYSPVIENGNRLMKFLSSALFWLPEYLILRLLLPKRKVEYLDYSSKAIKRGNIGMILYILLSMTLIVFAVKTK